ncbi:MAG: PGF-CTERM sorting domain-containing protein [Euryarchaeota archaeon]|nr:PGF-CTERM sorting domain-containing protein [Euryarchaeota archaeon]
MLEWIGNGENKMKWKTGFVLVLVMSAVASMAVTNVFGQDITAEELSNNTRDAIPNVTTVKYDQDMILTAHGESVEDHSHSTVDYEAERSYTSGSISVTYVDGKNVYVRMGEGDWEKQDIDYQWSMENKVEEFLGCKPPLYMNILRSEVVNGEDCWAVKCWPVNPLPNLELTAINWIAKEDYLPIKSQVRTRLTTDDLTTTRTIYFYDYNEPLDLPEPPTTPSFEFIFALAGLLTVGYLIKLRRKN